MIVLNGEPFTRYNLQSLYPFAHQIIVVEGACRAAAAVATPEGHSLDATVKVLHEFKEREDRENKLVIVSASDEGYPNGFWPDKDEMSRAYARRATGDYLWQVDCDEFYHEDQIARLMALLSEKRPDSVSFPTINFWGSLDYTVDSFYLIRDKAREYHRIFAWRPGYVYQTHFPPTVVDGDGKDLRRRFWVRARDLEKIRVFLYHYSLLFPQQVSDKTSYYKERSGSSMDTWEETIYYRLERPFHAHNVYRHVGWLQRFTGEHPAIVRVMLNDINAGRLQVKQRNCTDVEQLLSQRRYVAAAAILRALAHLMAIQPINFLHRVSTSVTFRIQGFLRIIAAKKKG